MNQNANVCCAAAIFDLDGVVTRTAKNHAAAWKALFDDYLRQRADRLGGEFQPFDITTDYRRYVDGKPRYDGVKSFLESRGIQLPYGSPKDPPDMETVCGLGNKKNRLFQEHLKAHGVEVFRSTIDFIEDLRSKKILTAIVSSSKNCAAVLEVAGITHLFDVKVDGTDSERLGLEGKPSPDIFIEAARQLGVPPERAVVLEDAIAGVRAGRRGKFAWVIGVDRGGQASALRENGADIVVGDISEITMARGTLPSALDRLEEIRQTAAGKRLVIFLDYDGTLTPIVSSPEKAVLAQQMRGSIERLSKQYMVAVISGRGLRDVQQHVGIDGIFYAGSHGFEIAGPRGEQEEYAPGKEFLPVLDRVERAVRGELEGIDGVLIERKKFSLAVHFRQARQDDLDAVKSAAERAAKRHAELRLSSGKKIYELQPKIDWHKGKALYRVLELAGLDKSGVLPLYIGDDVTDEDAFRAIRNGGVGIVVGNEQRPTQARYALRNTDEVGRFLEALASNGGGR